MTQATKTRKAAPAKAAAPAAPAAPAAVPAPAPGEVLVDSVFEWSKDSPGCHIYEGEDEILVSGKQYLRKDAGKPASGKVRIVITAV